MKKLIFCLFVMTGCGKPSDPTTAPTHAPRTIAEIDKKFFDDKAKRDEDAKTPATKPVGHPTDRTPVESLSALHLWNAYRDNELGADGKYRNKYVTIKGRAGKTGRDAAGKPFIQFGQNLASGATPPAVVCVIAGGSESDFGTVKEGATITVTGKVIGKRAVPDTFGGFIVVLHDTALTMPGHRDSGKVSP